MLDQYIPDEYERATRTKASTKGASSAAADGDAKQTGAAEEGKKATRNASVDWADAHDDMDYGVLPAFPDGRQHAPSGYEREKQQARHACTHTHTATAGGARPLLLFHSSLQWLPSPPRNQPHLGRPPSRPTSRPTLSAHPLTLLVH